MGLLDLFTSPDGLLGLGGLSGNQPATSLLGGLYDPQQLQKAKLKGLLLGSAIGLLGQKPSATPITFGSTVGSALSSGLTDAQQAGTDYMTNVKDALQLKHQQSQELAYQSANPASATRCDQRTSPRRLAENADARCTADVCCRSSEGL